MTKDEIKMFQEKSASGLCMRVYYSRKQLITEGEPRPSIKSIAERMGYDLTQNYQKNIGRALKWLDDNGFIKRKSRRSMKQAEIKCGIYQIKTERGIYVGQSRTIDKRWRQHERCIENDMHRYIRPSDVCEFSILEECETQELLKKELLWANKISSEGEMILNKDNFIFI